MDGRGDIYDDNELFSVDPWIVGDRLPIVCIPAMAAIRYDRYNLNHPSRLSPPFVVKSFAIQIYSPGTSGPYDCLSSCQFLAHLAYHSVNYWEGLDREAGVSIIPGLHIGGHLN